MNNSTESLPDECLRLLNLEQALFSKEYRDFYAEGETKPEEVGSPYLLHNAQSKKGVLLIHGLMAAPEEVREWAEYLYDAGYSVYAPRMAGHGTSSLDLSHRNKQEWVSSVSRGHDILKTFCETITIAGFSTGASVALQQVIRNPDAFDAIISISAPLKLKSFSANFAGLLNTWNRFFSAIGLSAITKPYASNHADNPHINYLRCPINSVVQIQKLMKSVVVKLSGIKIPSLVIHGTGDPKVDVAGAREIFNRISSTNKTYKEIDANVHDIVRGEIAESVFEEVSVFLKNLELTESNI